MTNPPELRELEQRRYGATYADGVIDIFVGVSMAWIGAIWLLFPDYLSGAVALVAVSISPVMRRRRRLVEARTGYVRFTEPRRRQERRIYTTAGFLFAGFMLIARPLGSLQPEDIDWPVGPDSLITWLLALIAVALGFFVDTKRLSAYAATLVATGAVALTVDTRFGWPLLVSGAVIMTVGWLLLRQFLDRRPRIEAS
ncbi:MAG: hypothetical protein ACR2OI_04540 [Acidimicrobiia bacterium]